MVNSRWDYRISCGLPIYGCWIYNERSGVACARTGRKSSKYNINLARFFPNRDICAGGRSRARQSRPAAFVPGRGNARTRIALNHPVDCQCARYLARMLARPGACAMLGSPARLCTMTGELSLNQGCRRASSQILTQLRLQCTGQSKQRSCVR